MADDLEALERRKRELELRRDISRLERSESLRNKAANIASAASGAASSMAASVTGTLAEKRSRARGWSWLWVAPCGLLGIYLIAAALFGDGIVFGFIGAVLLLPLVWKVARRT